MSAPEIELSRISGDRVGDNVITMEFDIEEDIPAELEEFVLHSRLGLFQTGLQIFNQTLERHSNLFPIVAEFADFLLEQQHYQRLSDFLSPLLANGRFQEDEEQLLLLLKALSDLHISGSLSKALSDARHWHTNMQNTKPPDRFTEAEVRSRDHFRQNCALMECRSFPWRSISRLLLSHS